MANGRWLLFSLLFSATSFAAYGQSADRCNNAGVAKSDGECWVTLSTLQKQSVVRGIWIGLAAEKLSLELTDSSPFWVKDFTASPNSTTIGDILTYYDKLYETPANRSIHWSWAYILAAMNARDDDSDDRLSLVRLLRSGKTPPTYAELVRAKTATTLQVKTDSSQFDIDLVGTSDKELSQKEKERAIDFLNGIRKMSYLSCRTAQPPKISLQYSTGIFVGDNHLAANAAVYGDVVCDGNKEVPLSSLGLGTKKSINFIMVRFGLLHATLNDLDPKWPDQTRNFIDFSYAYESAKSEALYIHGKNRNPTIDTIIEIGSHK